MSNSNNFVLQEVINNLVNSEKSLVDTLTKLNYFGMLIKNEELIQYTTNELNGYNASAELPSYRKIVGTLKIKMEANHHYHDGEIPLSMLDEPFKTSLKYLTIKEGIGTIEHYVKDIQSNRENRWIRHPLPMEMLVFIEPAAKKLYRTDARINLVGAQIIGPSHIMIEIINAVRTKLLALIMKIGDEVGLDVEITSFKINQDNINQTINNYMKTEITNTGDGNVVNTGNNSTITVTTTISKGDIDQLDKALGEYGIDTSDIGELKEIIKTEEPDYENKKLGIKTNTWIGGIVGKSLNGVGKIATTITGNILATLIKSYFGIHN